MLDKAEISKITLAEAKIVDTRKSNTVKNRENWNYQIMEEILCRFQHLGEQIFAELGDVSLAKSRETSRSWLDFICNKKFYKNRINEMLANKATDYGKLRGELLR